MILLGAFITQKSLFCVIWKLHKTPRPSSTNGSAIASSPVDPVFPFPYPSTQHIPKQTTPTPDIIFPLTDSRSHKHALAHINQQDNGSQISEPRSESFPFKLSCRCGQSGDATKIDSHLAKVQCIFCNQWSHVACQTDGRADPSTLIEDFICDSCQGPRYVMTVSISLINSYWHDLITDTTVKPCIVNQVGLQEGRKH